MIRKIQAHHDNGDGTYPTIEYSVGTVASDGALVDTVSTQTITGDKTFTGAMVLPSGTTIGGSAVAALGVVTSTSANALAIGRQGATNPVLNVDASTSSVATGVKIKGAAAAGGVAISAISSGTNESLTIDAKGSGTITLNGTGTGNIVLGRTTTLTLSSSSTDGGTSVEPFVVDTTMTGAGGVGGRAKFALTTNVALGAWSNALKGIVTYGASGKTTGLGSGICSEVTLSAGTVDGTYTGVEIELNLGSGAKVGTSTSLIYASVNGADAATFSTGSSSIMNLNGLTAGATNVFRTGLVAATVNAACTAALRIKVNGTSYYIPLATATT